MPKRVLIRQIILSVLVVALGFGCVSLPAAAASVDNYVTQYLKATEPVPLEMSGPDSVRLFSPEELTAGKQLFEAHCKNCHVGGATLPNPLVSLSLDVLRRATPPRDTINSLVAFQRLPMTYDGSEESFWCRQVPDTWLSTAELESLEAFVLRAAQKAPGWGSESF